MSKLGSSLDLWANGTYLAAVAFGDYFGKPISKKDIDLAWIEAVAYI